MEAQPLPPVGGVVPDAVENVPGQPPFIYVPGFVEGDKLQPGEGSMAYALDAEIRKGMISEDQARQSASIMGLSGYVPLRTEGGE